MTRKTFWIIVCAAVLTFGNCLWCGFVGDDHSLIVRNDFFKSPANIQHLFSSRYNAVSDDVYNNSGHSFHSGSVAYRPVLSLTYFLDYALWGNAAWGYHLTNLALHVVNCLLAYLVVFSFFPKGAVALWSALLFCVHPLRSEAVCAIGYRADVLATCFVLLAFLFFQRWQAFLPGKKRGSFAACLFFFFLALFTKESAIVFPGLLILYHFYFMGKRGERRDYLWLYGGVGLISLGYLFVYLKVFPNTALGGLTLLGGTWARHGATIFVIFSYYAGAFFNPAAVRVLPPLYFPSPRGFEAVEVWVAVMAFLIFAWAAWRFYEKEKGISFFMLWFLLSYIPVSNLVPLVNPVAHRFLYLPSLGLSVLAAFLLERTGAFVKSRWPAHASLAAIGKAGIVVVCMGMTASLNSAWKNSYVMAAHIARDYPDNPQGHMFLGLELFRGGRFLEAKESFLRAVERSGEDPRLFHYLGICLLREPEQANYYFEKNIRMFPRFALSYIARGRDHLLRGEAKAARAYLEQGLKLSPVFTGYFYLMQTYLMEGDKETAGRVLASAREILREKGHVDQLERLYSLEWSGPVDVGI